MIVKEDFEKEIIGAEWWPLLNSSNHTLVHTTIHGIHIQIRWSQLEELCKKNNTRPKILLGG